MHLLFLFITGTCQTFHTDRNCGTVSVLDCYHISLVGTIHYSKQPRQTDIYNTANYVKTS